jgi:nucleotide-binding universal stress UspA family protein
MKHILVAYDGSQPSERAFDFGLTLAGMFQRVARAGGGAATGAVDSGQLIFGVDDAQRNSFS